MVDANRVGFETTHSYRRKIMFHRKFNQAFAILDAAFRDIEKESGCRWLPHIDIPGILDEATQSYTYEDEDKVVHYKNGALHREDGPAVFYHRGGKENEYWLEGRRATKEEVELFAKEKRKKKIYSLTLDGKDYKITGEKLDELKKWLDINSSK